MLLIPDSEISINDMDIYVTDWRIYNNGKDLCDNVEFKGYIPHNSSKKEAEPKVVKQLKPKLTKEETIEVVIEHFNFAKVEACMLYLDWIWWSIGRAPTVNELKKKANELLSEVYRKVQESTSKAEVRSVVATGGLQAEAVKYPDGEITVELKFVLTEFNYSNQDTCY